MRSEFELMSEERRNSALKLKLGDGYTDINVVFRLTLLNITVRETLLGTKTMTQATSSFEKTAESVFRM